MYRELIRARAVCSNGASGGAGAGGALLGLQQLHGGPGRRGESLGPSFGTHSLGLREEGK